MPNNDHDPKPGNVSRVVAGAAGIVFAFLVAWGWWALSGRWQLLSSSLLVIGLAAAGFGLGILLLEGFKRLKPLFKKRARRRARRPSATPPAVPVSEPRHSEPRREGAQPERRRDPGPDVPARRPSLSLPWGRAAAVVVGVIVVLSGAALALAWFGNDEERKSEPRRVTKDEVARKMEQLSAKLPYLLIENMSTEATGDFLSLVNKDGTPAEAPTAQYRVSVQNKYAGKVSIFNAKEYFMPSSPENMDSNVRDLCGTIDKTLEGQDEILKVLQDLDLKASLSLSLWGVVDAGIEGSPSKAWLVQMAAFLRGVTGLPAKRVEVLVKGYADGQEGPWKKDLMKEPYNYKVVNVYPRDGSDYRDSFDFIRSETPVTIPDLYSNEHLPELRARFVTENFIGKFLRRCKTPTETEVHILKGYADDSKNIREPDRRVEIFVNVY